MSDNLGEARNFRMSLEPRLEGLIVFYVLPDPLRQEASAGSVEMPVAFIREVDLGSIVIRGVSTLTICSTLEMYLGTLLSRKYSMVNLISLDVKESCLAT